MLRYLAYVLAFAVLAIGGAQAQSIHTMPVGTEVEGKVRFARSDVPLPPGTWILAAAGEVLSQNIDGSRPARIPYASLAQIRNNSLAGLVSLTGTVQVENLQWGRDRECDRTDFLLVDADRNYNPAEQFCLRVNHGTRTWVAASDADNQTKQLYAYLREANIARPSTMLGTVLRIVQRGEFLRVTYEVLPSAFGGPTTRNNNWTTSEWHVDAIGANPAHRRFADAWIEWSKAIAPQVKAGFGRTLQGYTPAAINGFDTAAIPPAAPVTGEFRAPVVGTRFVLASGHFEIARVDDMMISTLNSGNQGAAWFAGGLVAFATSAKFDRALAASIFPLAVGKKVEFLQSGATGTDAWLNKLEVLRTEELVVDGRSYVTYVIDTSYESAGPGMAETKHKRTIWYAPSVGWLLRYRSERLVGPPANPVNWDVLRIVPPGG
jgi:hypothetical protein